MVGVPVGLPPDLERAFLRLRPSHPVREAVRNVCAGAWSEETYRALSAALLQEKGASQTLAAWALGMAPAGTKFRARGVAVLHVALTEPAAKAPRLFHPIDVATGVLIAIAIISARMGSPNRLYFAPNIRGWSMMLYNLGLFGAGFALAALLLTVFVPRRLMTAVDRLRRMPARRMVARSLGMVGGADEILPLALAVLRGTGRMAGYADRVVAREAATALSKMLHRLSGNPTALSSTELDLLMRILPVAPPPLALPILRTFEATRHVSARDCVARLARGSQHATVKECAAEVVNRLEQDLRRQNDPRRLLRSSNLPQNGTGVLLHVTDVHGQEPPEQLLRSV